MYWTSTRLLCPKYWNYDILSKNMQPAILKLNLYLFLYKIPTKCVVRPPKSVRDILENLTAK